MSSMHLLRLAFAVVACLAISPNLATAGVSASAIESVDAVTLDNGLVRIVLRKSNAQVQSVSAVVNGKMTLLSDERTRNALYLDWNASPDVIPPDLKERQPRAGYGGPGAGATIRIVNAGPDVAEVAVTTEPSQWSPFAVEYRYRLPRDERKFYAWVRYSHGKGMPAGNIGQSRFVFRGVTGPALFTHHVVDDTRKGPYSTSPVISVVQDATTLHADGSVHTKYDNSAFTEDYLAHGLWGNGVGVWLLWPSTEFCNSGPVRQDLTVHGDNVILAMFQSGHYGAGPIRFQADEEWAKFCGPVVYYINEASTVDDAFADAKAAAARERDAWPFAWVDHPDYPKSRGTVRGLAWLADSRSTAGALAVLSPVEAVDWARSARGYQFFTRVAADGTFELRNVRPGKYKLNLSGADQPSDFEQVVDVSPDKPTDLGTLNWQPESHGATLWQVGTFDRGTSEFMCGDDPRNYLRFLDYFKAFPNDVTFTPGKSDPKKDWFYAQWSWFNKTPRWTIAFDTAGEKQGTATLTIGIASREYAPAESVTDVADRARSSGVLVVRLNGAIIGELKGPKTGAAGYRSASQDSDYVLERVTFDASRMVAGPNQITFEHSASRPFPTDPAEREKLRRPRGSVMYDAIRLEVQR
jgi:rhamnogalacturonan endolyase